MILRPNIHPDSYIPGIYGKVPDDKLEVMESFEFRIQAVDMSADMGMPWRATVVGQLAPRDTAQVLKTNLPQLREELQRELDALFFHKVGVDAGLVAKIGVSHSTAEAAPYIWFCGVVDSYQLAVNEEYPYGQVTFSLIHWAEDLYGLSVPPLPDDARIFLFQGSVLSEKGFKDYLETQKLEAAEDSLAAILLYALDTTLVEGLNKFPDKDNARVTAADRHEYHMEVAYMLERIAADYGVSGILEENINTTKSPVYAPALIKSETMWNNLHVGFTRQAVWSTITTFLALYGFHPCITTGKRNSIIFQHKSSVVRPALILRMQGSTTGTFRSVGLPVRQVIALPQSDAMLFIRTIATVTGEGLPNLPELIGRIAEPNRQPAEEKTGAFPATAYLESSGGKVHRITVAATLLPDSPIPDLKQLVKSLSDLVGAADRQEDFAQLQEKIATSWAVVEPILRAWSDIVGAVYTVPPHLKESLSVLDERKKSYTDLLDKLATDITELVATGELPTVEAGGTDIAGLTTAITDGLDSLNRWWMPVFFKLQAMLAYTEHFLSAKKETGLRGIIADGSPLLYGTQGYHPVGGKLREGRLTSFTTRLSFSGTSPSYATSMSFDQINDFTVPDDKNIVLVLRKALASLIKKDG